MFYPGLVSISFRDHSPHEIASAAQAQGLRHIEWGSDVHAPFSNPQQLTKIAELHTQYGISCCSYGTYFRLGFTPISELTNYFHAAKILGTNIIRLWAGRKKATDCTPEERNHLFHQCRLAAALAQEHNMVICLECHRRSYTETKEGALELLESIHSPNFRMYWQPNPDISFSENLAYIKALQRYITHIHVFHWEGTEKLPLNDGIDTWKKYLSALHGDHHLLLEFMPDDRIQSLSAEAETLHNLIHL